jgi:hypothetical protein
MRKIGILIALIAAATLGISGTASAQEEEITGVGGAAGCPINNAFAEGGAPDFAAMGGQDCSGYPALKNPADDEGASIQTYVCGVVGATLTASALADGTLNDSVKSDPMWQDNCPAGGEKTCEEDPTQAKCPDGDDDDGNDDGNDDDDDDGNGGGGGDDTDVAGEVVAQNAASDGSLPRTGGGELLAGLGFGLTSLGAVVRRFIK